MIRTATKTLYEVINPSDKVILASDNLEAAQAAVLVVGSGQYGMHKCDDDSSVLPLFLFGGADDWAKENYNRPIEEFMDEWLGPKSAELAAVLDTFFLGHVSDFKSYEMGLTLIKDTADREAWRKHWKEERRSSMNDICGRAWRIAGRIREKNAA